MRICPKECSFGGVMSRWNWMAAKAFAPAALALVVALASMELVSGWAANPYLSRAAPVARWFPLAAIVFAVAYWGWVCVRLWRAERGEGLLCDCGGLLGRERDGRYGPYRKCLACSRNVARRHCE